MRWRSRFDRIASISLAADGLIRSLYPATPPQILNERKDTLSSPVCLLLSITNSRRHQACQNSKRAASRRLISYWFSDTFIKAVGNNSHFLRLERTSKRLEAELLEHKRRSVRCARSHPDKTSCAQIATCLLPDTTLDEACSATTTWWCFPVAPRAPAGSRPMRVCRRSSRAWPRTAVYRGHLRRAPGPGHGRSPAGQAGHRLSGDLLQGIALHDVTVRDTGLERDGKVDHLARPRNGHGLRPVPHRVAGRPAEARRGWAQLAR
jgi:hypothetical protein